MFFRFAPDGEKSKKRVLNAIGRTFVNPGFLPLGLEKPTRKCRGMKPTVVEFDPKGVFSFSPPMGKVEKTRVFERNWTTFVNPAFCPCLEKPTQNGGMKTDLVEFDPKGVFSFRPDGESRKKRVLNAIGRRSSTRLFALLGKGPTQNGGMKTDLVEFDPKGVFFVSPRWGKSKKRVLNAIGRRSVSPRFECAFQAGAKMPGMTNRRPIAFKTRFFRPRSGRKSKKHPFGIELRRGSVSYPAFCPGLGKA